MKHDGPTIMMGGTEWVVPPLTLKSLRKFAPLLSDMQIGTIPTAEQFDLVRDIIFAALTRNYEDLKLDQLEELLDTRNMAGILNAVLSASGMVKRGGPTGEA